MLNPHRQPSYSGARPNTPNLPQQRITPDDADFQSQPNKRPKLNSQLPTPQNDAVIDIITSGPLGDTVIQLQLPNMAIDAGRLPAMSNGMGTTKTQLIRVHGIILTLISPVFAQILSSAGPDKKFTAASPLRLPPDIDHTTFLDWVILICNQTKHLQAGNQKKGQQGIGGDSSSTHEKGKKKQSLGRSYFSRLPRVVALSERLGCAEGMKSWCSMPLWAFFGLKGEANGEGLKEAGLSVLDAISIAYVIQDAILFKRATEYALIHLNTEHLEAQVGGGLGKIVPKNLIETIKQHRGKILSDLEIKLYAPIQEIHTKFLDPEDAEDTPIEPCELATEKLALYSLQLCHLKRGKFSFADSETISCAAVTGRSTSEGAGASGSGSGRASPLGDSIETRIASNGGDGGSGSKSRSVAEIWELLEEMQEVLPKSNKKCGKNCEGGCTVDVRAPVAKLVQESKEGVAGLCLECLLERERKRKDVMGGAGGDGGGGNGVGEMGECLHDEVI